MRLTKRLLVFASLIFVVACGENRPTPLAFRQIDGSMSELGLKPAAVPRTLLNEVVKNGVPQVVATAAFAKYDQFESRVKRTEWMGVIDFTKASSAKRFYMINLKSGAVEKTVVAHGSGSDPKNTGTPSRFSNSPNSLQTSLGAYLVNEKFHSPKHGTAARLDGLESTNSFARPRAIILHSASYVVDGRAKQGMSWGCPAVSFKVIATALARFSGGGFLYHYGRAPERSFLDESRAQEMMVDPSFHWLSESEDAPVDGVGGD